MNDALIAAAMRAIHVADPPIRPSDSGPLIIEIGWYKSDAEHVRFSMHWVSDDTTDAEQVAFFKFMNAEVTA